MEKLGISNILGNIQNRLSAARISKANNASFNASTNPIQQSPIQNTYAANVFIPNTVRTQMNRNEVQMYNTLASAFINEERTSDVSTSQKINDLLRTGKLLDSSSNDGSTTLENIYKILTTPRFDNVSAQKIAKQTIDMIYKPSVGTQRFGDIPKEFEQAILNSENASEELKADPSLMDVKTNGSGTCPVASLASNMAHRMPSEYARWINELSSPDMCVKKRIKLSSLSGNPLNALELLKMFNVDYKFISFNEAQLSIRPDKNARIRAKIQEENYDPGERTIVDVLMQSTLMNLGAEQTYDSLTDTINSNINPNNQGLTESQKTLAESIAKADENGEEMLSIIYQNVDDNQKLTGYRCGFNKIKEHITRTLDEGKDVIVGCTAIDSDKTILGGHEITIVGYNEEPNGNITFICNDTDDGIENFVEYSADELLPKIHHAGYPAHIVKDEKELLYAA